MNFKNTDTLWAYVRGIIKKGRRLNRELVEVEGKLFRHDIVILKHVYYLISMEVHKTNKGRMQGGELEVRRYTSESAAENSLKNLIKT